MKIQLKRSNVLVENNARQPTAGQMEYGELAVNYNTTDPAIFIKDSNNNIVRIAGKYNIADDGQVELPATPTPPSNPKAGNLWYNNVDGRLYIYYTDEDTSQWVDASPDSWDPSSYPDVSDDDAQAGTLDDRYLMLNADNSPVTGTCEFSDGISVTGGDQADGKIVELNPGLSTGGVLINSTNRILVGNPGKDNAVAIASDDLNKSSESSSLYSFFTSTGHTNNVNAIKASIRADTGSPGVVSVFKATAEVNQTNGEVRGFHSYVNTGNAPTVYNFYASGTAPNYFASNVGIGTETPFSLLHIEGSRNYTGNTPSPTSYDFNVISGTAGVGLGKCGDIPAIQAYGGGTSYNLALNPNNGNVGIGLGADQPQNKLHVTDATAANDTPEVKIESYRPTLRFHDLSDNQSSGEICGDNALMFRVSPALSNTVPLTERMRITDNGDVGINQPSPTSRLDVRDGNIHVMPTGVLPWNSNSTAQNEGSYVGQNGRINLYHLDTNTEAFYTSTNINSTTGVRSSVFSVNNTGLITAPAGIRFANDKETLDDYEEGTFVMRVASTGNIAGSMASTTGRYTKIGRLVRVSAKLLANNVQTAGHSGTIILKGFPFSGGSDNLESIATPIAYNGVYGKYAITYDFPGAFDYLNVCNSASSGDKTALFPNGSNIRYYFSFTYTVYD